MKHAPLRTLVAQVPILLRGTPVSGTLAWPIAVTVTFGFLFGGVMGSFGGLDGGRLGQVLVSGLKVPLLLLTTFALSVPSFFVLNTLAGVRSDFIQALRCLVGGQAVFTLVLAVLAPYTLLWYASFPDYAGAVLFNGVLFAIASVSAQGWLRRQYRALVQRDARHRTLLRLWLVIYSFVAIQMAWTLRPFIGEPGSPVQFFRPESWGNAYVVVGGIVWRTLWP